ncbi:MAG: UDP-N-acetylmuramoyl-L-alanyl-D-glutamate--2,6-diaminopimelate ligase [Pseudomonadota bacterium]
MKLSELIKDCPGINFDIKSALAFAMAVNNPDIAAITSDSRQVQPGSLFIAVKGFKADGHHFIHQAFENGAVAVVAQEKPDALKKPDAQEKILVVENSRQCMAALAANFYGHPSQGMTLVGITGTNGKTTNTWLIESIFNAAGFNTGVIGTINIRYNGQHTDNPMTTPDAINLQKILKEMKTAGITHVIMEVSSHGLDLNRVDGCQFDVGVFTNLTQDHLDYHQDMDDYFNCKQQLFTRFLGPGTPKNGIAVLNVDDPKGAELFNTLECRCLGVSRVQETDIHSKQITDDINGLSGTICLGNGLFNFTSALTGRFNLENILCAAGAAHALKIPLETIKAGIQSCQIIPGRLEKIANPIGRHIFVDYAHTPDALKSILSTLKQRAPKRLITVFGCGGDRDTTKRPLMGTIAGKFSDITIVTSDNPRTEDPNLIISQILAGMTDFEQLTPAQIESNPFRPGIVVEPNRKKALEQAIMISKPGDTIVAAGKGHETYQILGSDTIHFDDSEELKIAAHAFNTQFLPIDWTIQDLAAALEVQPTICTLNSDQRFAGICTDSRHIKTDQVFLALKGDHFDGHSFIPGLIDQGIKAIIAEHGFPHCLNKGTTESATENALLIFEVADTLIALGQLARYQRQRSNVRLVAVTGSSGKTTTRKIIEQIFNTRFHTHSTHKNFNNEIGVPLTLLNLSARHEWAIVEMGMNHAGEILRLSRMAMPDIAIITNTAGVHLEGLGSVENVARAKAEIFEGIKENGTAILSAQDMNKDILESAARKQINKDKILFFGSGPESVIQAENIDTQGQTTQFTALFDGQQCPVQIHSPARFMVDNCLAAIAVARTAGIDSDCIQRGIAAFKPAPGRMNIYQLCENVHVIDDTYNANPASVAQALHTLASVSKGQTSIAVLGDMLELGTVSDQLHYEIGQLAARLGINQLFLYGTQVEQIQNGAIQQGFTPENIWHTDKEQIVQTIISSLEKNTWILVKGSRGMTMENVIKGLQTISTVNLRGYGEK